TQLASSRTQLAVSSETSETAGSKVEVQMRASYIAILFRSRTGLMLSTITAILASGITILTVYTLENNKPKDPIAEPAPSEETERLNTQRIEPQKPAEEKIKKKPEIHFKRIEEVQLDIPEP